MGLVAKLGRERGEKLLPPLAAINWISEAVRPLNLFLLPADYHRNAR
jgi:hypothetical protein